MSGIEVAGLVLGAIPLLISALEHYSDGVSTLKSMYNYGLVFEQLHAAFLADLDIYRNSLEKLLSPLPLSDSQLYLLLEGKDTAAWEEPELAACVRERLGNNYLKFRSSVKQLNKRIKLLAHKLRLKIDDDMKPPWVSQTGIDTEARDRFFRNPVNRMRGGFNTGKHKELLDEVEKDINRIATLTAGAIALEPLRLSRKRRVDVAYWERFQQYADQLYESLRSRWSTQCACQCPHEANLKLELQDDDTEQATKFTVLFSFNAAVASSQKPWSWRVIEIEPSETKNCRTHGNVQTVPKVVVHRSSENVIAWAQCVKAAPKIQDSCKALKKNVQGASCIGMVEDVTCQYHIHSPALLVYRSAVHGRTTLQDLFDNRIGSGLTVREKSITALTLTKTVLRFHGTAWLEDTWSMHDLVIVNDGQVSPASQHYISKRISGSTSPIHAQVTELRIIKNAAIFALGVALLELSYGKGLSTFETPGDLDSQGNRTSLTDYYIACRLVEGVRTQELPNFANSTYRCVHCNFESTSYSLKNDDLRERVYQGGVVPLQKDYEYIMERSS